MKSKQDLRFSLICLVLFCLGGLLRIQSGWLAWPQQVSASSLALDQELNEAALAELHQTVLDFYHLVDKGSYAAAYQLSYENKWLKSAEKSYTPNGLTSQDEFIDVLSNEIGSNGMGLNIISIQVQGQRPLPPEEWSVPNRPELQTLKALPSESQVQAVFEVEVGGVLLGRCSRWDWRNKVLVAKLSGEQGWRLLLPGSLEPSSPHHEEWFLDRDPFKGKTIVLEAPQI